MHPLGKNANSAIVIAFTETWFRNMIVDIISNPKQNGLKLGTMKVEPHLPIIISSLRHEAVLARRKKIEGNKDTPGKKFIVTTHLKRPWVRLCEEETIGGNKKKTVLAFEVEDYRLAHPELYHTDDFEPLFIKKRKNGGQMPAGFLTGVSTEAVPLGEMRSMGGGRFEWEQEADEME
jgi:hypothetical protein